MFEMLDNAISKSESKTDINELGAILSTQSTQGLNLPHNSIDYAFMIHLLVPTSCTRS